MNRRSCVDLTRPTTEMAAASTGYPAQFMPDPESQLLSGDLANGLTRNADLKHERG